VEKEFKLAVGDLYRHCRINPIIHMKKATIPVNILAKTASSKKYRVSIIDPDSRDGEKYDPKR
jgi:hypothetical protein